MKIVQLFKVLADETRLRILNLLCRRELCVCHLTDILGVGQSKVSRHLAHLRNANLVVDRREGLWIYYSLTEPTGKLHRQIIDWFRQGECEIPMGAQDILALERLGQCSDLSPNGSACDEINEVELR